MISAGANNPSRCWRPSPPISQNTIAGRVSSGLARYSVTEINAPNTLAITIPASTSSIAESRPMPRPMISANAAASSPPANAIASSCQYGACSNSASAPPKPAPADTPRMSGDTSGLRNIV